jgi:hypothetical protein
VGIDAGQHTRPLIDDAAVNASPDICGLSLGREKKPSIAGRQVFFAGIAVERRFRQ